ncbi:hypothetical protein ALC62_12761, partial [Cyphomyrmex costatus]
VTANRILNRILLFSAIFSIPLRDVDGIIIIMTVMYKRRNKAYSQILSFPIVFELTSDNGECWVGKKTEYLKFDRKTL